LRPLLHYPTSARSVAHAKLLLLASIDVLYISDVLDMVAEAVCLRWLAQIGDFPYFHLGETCKIN
jgi:hypothetical protein